jgi:hypothetical protein
MARTVLYNIRTNEIYNNNWTTSECGWFEEIDRRWTMFHDDVMLIEFIEDIEDPDISYSDTMTNDLIREDYIDCFKYDYPMIWRSVKSKFEEELNSREIDGISKRYLIDMILTSHRCYEGDYDLIADIGRILECSNGSFNEIELIGDN